MIGVEEVEIEDMDERGAWSVRRSGVRRYYYKASMHDTLDAAVECWKGLRAKRLKQLLREVERTATGNVKVKLIPAKKAKAPQREGGAL